MSERSVDLSFLQKAVARLDAGLTRYRQDIHDEQIRDGLIQRFEFTYEISHKTLKRFLEATSASPQEIDRMTYCWEAGRTGGLIGTYGPGPAIPTARKWHWTWWQASPAFWRKHPTWQDGWPRHSQAPHAHEPAGHAGYRHLARAVGYRL